jgi:transglutaminase-like putative cysteine protease
MLYDIALSIGYRYDNPANSGRHLLRLMPAHIEGRQRLIAGALDINPRADERHTRQDFFGAAAIEAVVHAPHDEITFTLKCRVEKLPEAPRVDISPPRAGLQGLIDQTRTLAPDAPHHFLGLSPYVHHAPEIAAFATMHTAHCMTTLETIETLSRALHAHMHYAIGATDVDTRPEDAFARGRGVCQDYSHILIAGLRSLGVPAGYVSGFIRTRPPEGAPRLEGADAMHAWVRAWCGPAIGWVEIDPTNAIWAGEDHIIIAYGRDYADVAPVKGVLRMAGSQSSRHVVDVSPAAL